MHWAQQYVGQPYVEDEQDCGAFAERVQHEVFRREVRLPSERARGLRGKSRQIESLLDDYGSVTDAPVDGDAVLMKGGSLWHIGVYALIGGTPYVLHAMKNAGQVVLHRIRDLPNQGLVFEGFYKWK